MRIIAFEPDYNPEHREVLRALAAGIPNCEVRTLGNYEPCDIAIIFGGYKKAFKKTLPKREILAKHSRRSLLMVEAGFVKRGEYYAIGWGGQAGGADFNAARVPYDRWQQIGIEVKPWKNNPDGHVVVMGQLPRDVQVQDTDHIGWCRQMVASLQYMGKRVVFRPHPKMINQVTDYGIPDRLIDRSSSLQQCINGAEYVVTYNSTSAIDCLIEGIPVVTMHPSAQAWPVAGHHLAEVVRPDRTAFFAELGFSIWTLHEMRAGLPWEHLNSSR